MRSIAMTAALVAVAFVVMLVQVTSINGEISVSPATLDVTIEPGIYETNLTLTNDGDVDLDYEILFDVESSALDLDGSDDYINVGDETDFDGTGGLTVEAWIKPESLTAGSGYDRIVTKSDSDSGTSPGWRLQGSQDGGRISFSGVISSTGERVTTSTVFDATTWYHIAGTWDRSELRIYVNGNLEDTEPTGSSMSTNNRPLLIGAIWRGSGSINTNSLFDGGIDEVRILNRALSAQEIDDDYQAMGEYPARSGTVAWFHFDENSGDKIYDSSGNDYTGTIDGGAQWIDSFKVEEERDNAALNLDGSNDYINVGDESDFDGTDGLTVEAWIKPESLTAGSGYDRIVTKSDSDSGTSPGWKLQGYQDSGRISFSGKISGTGERVTTSTVFDATTWYHIAATWDRSELRIYVNGNLEDTEPTGSSMSTNSRPLLIGAIWRGSGSINTNSLFDGGIDEVRILDRALSAQEIDDDYQALGEYPARSGTVAWWHFDENSGDKIYDSSGNDYTGNIYGGAQWVDSFNAEEEERDNAALNLDGSNDYINVGDESDFDGTGGLTVEAWIKPESLTASNGFDRIITKSDSDSGTSPGWRLQGSQDSGRISFSGVISSTGEIVTTSTVFDASTWYYIAATWDQSELRIYVNGNLEDKEPTGTTMSTNNRPLLIGAIWTGSGDINTNSLFDGRIDEVRILDRALSAQEIEDDYRAYGEYPDRSGTVAWFHFDENSGNKIYDSSGYDYTGSVYGGAQWVDTFITRSSGGISWLTVTPRQGSISPSAQAYLNVVMGSEQLEPGFYSTNLTVETNDTNNTLVKIPVNLTILRPAHDLVLRDVDVPGNGWSGTSMGVNADIFNRGTNAESEVLVRLLVDGIPASDYTISSIEPGQTISVNLSWTPELGGHFQLAVQILPVSGETLTFNNLREWSMVVLTRPQAHIDSITPLSASSGQSIIFTGHGEDLDGTIVSHRWRSSLDGELSTAASFTRSDLSSGEHTIYYQVKDDDGLWSEEVSRTIFVNSLPEAIIDTISPSPAERGTAVALAGHGSDADGEIVAYEWISSLDGKLGELNEITINDLSPGHHTISFKVQDDEGLWSRPVEAELWIYARPDVSAGENVITYEKVPVQFAGQASDADGTVVLYEWDFDGNGVFEWSSPSTGVYSYAYNAPGNYTAILRVTDNDGYSTTDSIWVLVQKIEIPEESGLPGFELPSTLTALAITVVVASFLSRYRRRNH